MSVYTTQVRFICEAEAGLKKSVGYDDVNTVIQNAIPKIFNFSWPIFDESYRNVLETKILKHYYTREIGLETYGLWKLKLDTVMVAVLDLESSKVLVAVTVREAAVSFSLTCRLP